MRERLARLLPVAGRSGDRYHEEPPGAAECRGDGADAAAGGSRKDDRVYCGDAAACVHERGADQPDMESELDRLLRDITCLGASWLINVSNCHAFAFSRRPRRPRYEPAPL